MRSCLLDSAQPLPGEIGPTRPVTFRYKEDSTGTLQYGLIAEEVARGYPEAVTYGADGKVEPAAYHLLPAMLLNEIQKQARENQRKDARIAALQQQLVAQQSQIRGLQREAAQICSLAARLNALEEQARTARPEWLAACGFSNLALKRMHTADRFDGFLQTITTRVSPPRPGAFDISRLARQISRRTLDPQPAVPRTSASSRQRLETDHQALASKG